MMALDVDVRRLGRDVAVPLDGELRVTPSGDLQLVEGRTNLHEAVRRRLITQPATLVHRPAYGAGVPGYLERPANPATLTKMTNQARRNLLDDARLADVKVTGSFGHPSDASAAGVTIAAEITIKRDPAPESVTVFVQE